LIVSISASGNVSSANSTTVSTGATGVVKKLYVKNNDQVKSGQAIAEIDLDQTSAQKYSQALSSYQSAKNSLASAENNLNSLQITLFSTNQKLINDAVARDLATDDPTYIQENAAWLAAENSYKNQQAVISQVRTSLNSASMSLRQASPFITAPISGSISGMWLQIGSVITGSTSSTDIGGTKIASISTSAAPTVTVNLTEIDAPNVQIGNKATIILDAYPDKTFVGKVISIDRVGTVSSGVTNYLAVILLDSDGQGIYPNMSATATIILNSKADVLLVPTSAITTQDGTSTVQVMVDKKTRAVTVETGLSSDTQIEITSGLKEGDVVVTGTTTSTSTSQTTSPFSVFGGARVGGGGNVRFRD
jgi:RND family efflux transporter MFP subunit